MVRSWYGDQMPLVSLDRVSVAFGHLPLLDGITLKIEPRERLALIGRNGTGKSTLLRVLSGEQPADAGLVWRQPGIRVARLVQDVPLATDRPVFDVVADGLGTLSALVRDYHHATLAVAAEADGALERLGRLHHELEERDGWRLEQRVELVLSRLSLDADALVATLSGGWRRRVLLAQALVAQPDLLILDEPTNHLDIEAIEWLEQFLGDYAGVVVFVTHDRAFLERLATRVIELDRGALRSWPGDYPSFLRKMEESLAVDALQQEMFDRKLAEEEIWIRQGVKARRTRNEGRVKALEAMRAERAARREQVGLVRLQVADADPSGRLVFETEHLSKAFERPVVRDLSLRIVRGDRIGLIGPNGSGKTTLLRLLVGELSPDSGTVRRGTNVQIAYYDQQREQLDPERTVADTVADGNDTIVVNGQSRHVIGYLKDFLFPAERARSPVKALSGGERNRLLLARLFTRPANVLVMDEPTNDLDLETLELVEAQLLEFPGTLLLVSHDRTFLDNVITSTLAFEGNGRVQEYVGGYADWLRQRPTSQHGEGDAERPPSRESSRLKTGLAETASTRKLSYNEQRELERLPSRIDALEAEQAAIEAAIAHPDFYKEPADTIAARLASLATTKAALSQAYTRWGELDSRAR
jgi:ATP-binding cassette subfamily F protein uup